MADPADEFAAWLTSQGRAANTVASYRRDVTAYLRWCDQPRGGHPTGDNPLSAYVEFVRATKRPSSAARAVVALRIFHRWCGDTPAGQTRPELVGLPLADDDDGVPDLTESTIAGLLRVAEGDTVERRRDAVSIALLYFAGLKASEAVSLDLCDITADGAVITVDRDGPHERVLPAVPALQRPLDRWIDPAGRRRLSPKTEALLVNRRGQRLTRQGLWLITAAVARRAEIGEALSPNALRRACASHLADRGLTPPAIGAFLGHTQRRAPGAAMLNEAGWGSCNLHP